MYCMTCGNELPNGARACGVCGAEVPVGASDAPTFSAERPVHTSYEYTRTTVDSDLVTVTSDCYESLGWEITGATKNATNHSTTLSFRRSRKVKGKAQLVKLQHRMDDLIATLADLEVKKTRKGVIQALVLGIVSTLVLGIGMCFTMVWADTLMLPGVIIGVVGIVGCIANYVLFRRTVAKETARIAPRIEATYDSLATVCEEAQAAQVA